MKFEWKKQEKSLYLPKNKPEILTVPKFKFFTLNGRGNPNEEQFSEAIGVLYSLAYTIKMFPKKGVIPNGYFDYTVYPLEGIWDLEEEVRAKEKLEKNKLIYTIMIRQPDFVTEELAEEAIKSVKLKKPHVLLEDVRFEELEEGLCLQMMHIGSYDNEPASFSVMEEFCLENNLLRKSMVHKEIYISDFRKTVPTKLKTVLRYNVTYKL